MGRNKFLVLYLTYLLSVTVFARKKLLRQEEDSKDVADNVVNGENEDNNMIDIDKYFWPHGPTHGQGKLAHPDIQQDDDSCWKGRKHLEAKTQEFKKQMDDLRAKYAEAVEGFDGQASSDLLRDMLKSRAAAQRAIVDVGGNADNIPAGINLGSYGIMRMKNSILFFHRMKLRNQTIFRVLGLDSSAADMLLHVDLNLNDLHLVGDYERCLLDRNDIKKLYFMPNYGELNLLLKNVRYKVIGHYRYIQDRFYVEHIVSQLFSNNILLTYQNSSECVESVVVEPQAIQEFLERLKADLDAWLKDYFNDYLLYYNYPSNQPELKSEFMEYLHLVDQYVNGFTDLAIYFLKLRIRSLVPSCASVATPDFTLISVNGVRVKLTQGVLRGMDTFYRQGMATFRGSSSGSGSDLHVISDLGFSSLTLEYRYLAVVNQGVPPLTGMFRLDANDLMFHLLIDMNFLPINVETTFQFIRQRRPQTLVIEGPINRYISNWKHLLEDEIIALMTNTILYHVKQLTTLTNCVPSLTCLEPDSHRTNSSEDLTHPDYGAVRNDSIELELPEDGDHPAKKLKIRYYESVAVKAIHDERRMSEKAKKKYKPKLRTGEKKRSLKRKEQTQADKMREKEENREESERLGKKVKTVIKADDDSSVSHSYQAGD